MIARIATITSVMIELRARRFENVNRDAILEFDMLNRNWMTTNSARNVGLAFALNTGRDYRLLQLVISAGVDKSIRTSAS